MTIPFLACMVSVAAFYHLPPRVLPAIQSVEGGRPALVHLNRNGSEDLGVMQVNTRWVQPLAQQTGLSAAATRQRLLADPCFNIAVAGALVRICLQRADGNLMHAIGCYHSPNTVLAHQYETDVIASATRLFSRGPTRP